VPHSSNPQVQPVVANLHEFDQRSGSWVERILFQNRAVIVAICFAVSLLLGYIALTRLELNASFEKMLPAHHPYIVNYLNNKSALFGLGNSVEISVESTRGTIFTKEYLDILKRINDEVYFIPGVDRPAMRSLWTSNMRWTGVTEEGLEGGAVIPDHYDGSQQSLAQVQANVERSGEIGRVVANNFRSSTIIVPLLAQGGPANGGINYRALSMSLEAIRAKYSSPQLRIYITGFAKVVGDLIEGLKQVLLFFALAIAITMAILFGYTRCIRSTVLVVLCSLIAVIWQLGLVAAIGLQLNPYSVLVPFLVFAIGMSHGAQKMNGIMQDVGRGTHRLVAARYTFRRLFMIGLVALLCDTVGFAVLAVIDIRAIRELAVIASIGVAILIFTNLVLLPVLLSYTGVSSAAALRSLQAEEQARKNQDRWIWRAFDRLTRPRPAAYLIVGAAALTSVGLLVSSHLKIGDLDQGAPELRADSRYNRDVAFMRANYQGSSDAFVVMVKTPDNLCVSYETLSKVQLLEWQLQALPGVIDTNSMATLSTHMVAELNEGSLKWYQLVPTQGVLNAITTMAPRELFNQACNTLPVFIYLRDHRSDTLNSVVATVSQFAHRNESDRISFLMAAGPAGFEATTNIVVQHSMREMLLWVYGAVVLLCFVVFRSFPAVVAAVVPLAMTSVLCEAIMVALGMGVKVATLPVIALGVGIGVDYALYVLAVMLTRMRAGRSLDEAYHDARLFTGKVVMLTGLTLATAVGTWALSSIKFQADMGILLAFMFLWNMIGALVLLPAVCCFLMRPARTWWRGSACRDVGTIYFKDAA
jgi:predicted RND superfamily exporter protein